VCPVRQLAEIKNDRRHECAGECAVIRALPPIRDSPFHIEVVPGCAYAVLGFLQDAGNGLQLLTDVDLWWQSGLIPKSGDSECIVG
jgi:hypothetical protein